MAISIVKICNAALSLIGEKQITNATLSDTTEAERQCTLVYPMARDNVLRAHPWNFAEKRQALAALVDVPPFEFDLYYTLPSDCLRVLRLYDTELPFRIEADRKIATDATPCNLIYTAQITDVAQFDPGFTEALIYYIAAHLAMVLSDNRTLAAELRQEYEGRLRSAKMFDGQEGTPQSIKVKNSWTRARRGTISGRSTPWWRF